MNLCEKSGAIETIREKLNFAKHSKIPVSLYSDAENTTKFAFGYVMEVTDTFILFADISPNGDYDGFTARETQKVYKVEWNDKYGRRLEKIYKLKNQKHDVINCRTGDIITDLLYFALTKRLIVNIELFESDTKDTVGFVSFINNGIVGFQNIDENGESDGECICRLRDVDVLQCDSSDEQLLKLLNENIQSTGADGDVRLCKTDETNRDVQFPPHFTK
ncbi:MAG: hypothetical protein Q4C12_07255 [Clostridia bacterium]|nr:hypothetical protein [Clostridia bacterium]